MCTIVFHWDPAASACLTLAANRDEFRDRVADDPFELTTGVFAGRDRMAGGTWLAVSRRGVAALTNVRTGARDPRAPSRGALPLAALAGTLPPDLSLYNPFNLVVIDERGARVLTHADRGAGTFTTMLEPGLHVVDNEPFGQPSARVRRVATLVRSASVDFDVLGDHGSGAEDGLCHHGEVYGTVSATVVGVGPRFDVTRYAHVAGPPCRGTAVDLTAAARRVVG
jgi:uncharacterized protein with NRDE domain